jgi:hypothetical protein
MNHVGRTYDKGRRFARLYQATFPHRRHPNHKPFGAIDRRLRGAGTSKPFAVDWRRDRFLQASDAEEGVLDRDEENPGVNTTHVVTEFKCCRNDSFENIA